MADPTKLRRSLLAIVRRAQRPPAPAPQPGPRVVRPAGSLDDEMDKLLAAIEATGLDSSSPQWAHLRRRPTKRRAS